MQPYQAFIITIILGPVAFYLLSRNIYTRRKHYPTQLNDAIGDTIFLPWYNATFVRYLTDSFRADVAVIAFLTGMIITFSYVCYQKKAKYMDWSKPKIGLLNWGGRYHELFMLVQASLIVYGLLLFPSVNLWIPFIGYLSISVVQWAKYGYV
jgi:hypothetical protein